MTLPTNDTSDEDECITSKRIRYVFMKTNYMSGIKEKKCRYSHGNLLFPFN